MPREPDGSYDVEKVRVAWLANTHPQGRGRRAIPGGLADRSERPDAATTSGQFAAARAVRETFDARMSELRYKVRAGELVPSADVRAGAFAEARRARDLLLNLPARVGPIVAGLNEPAACIRVLNDEIARVLAEISSAPAPEASNVA